MWSAIFLGARLASIVRVSQIDKLGQETCENGRRFPRKKMLGYRKSFRRVTRADPRVVEKFGRTSFSSGPKILTATPLLLAIPRVFLPDDDLFLTYTSLGTRPRGHSTSLELEITSSWKPIFRGPTEMWRKRRGGEMNTWPGRMKNTVFPSLSLSLSPCGDSYALRYLYGILLSCRQTTGRKILG